MTELKPYLYRSFAAHAFLLAGFVLFGLRQPPPAAVVYAIDFVGGSELRSAGGQEAAPPARVEPAPSRVGPQQDPDAWATARTRKGPVALPRPSLLRGGREDEMKPVPKPTLSAGGGSAPAGVAAPGGTPGAGAGVTTDLPNFPYPWYVSQLRLMLWQAWQKRMPSWAGEGEVSFSILRAGVPTDLRMTSSSGDRAFDEAALASVQAAAPFPPLPSGFPDPFLKIHLTLRSE